MKPRKKNFQRFSHDLWETAKLSHISSPSRKARKKLSDYGKRLQARSLVKTLYGQIRTKYFRKLTDQASKMRLRRAAGLLTLLESRLDLILFRSGISLSLDEARQFINHGKIFVNGNVMTRPKFILQPGDIFSFPVSQNLQDENKKKTETNFHSLKKGKILPPLHVEVSYKLGRGIYLYRPQTLLLPRKPFADLAMESFSQ